MNEQASDRIPVPERKLIQWMDRNLFPNHPSNWDNELFREIVLAHLKPEHVLLDLGAGRGRVRQMNFRGLAARVCGVDPDERVVDNPLLDEGKVGMGESIPYPDETFDVVVSANVLEHLVRPEEVFREICRVMKPGGLFLGKTMNRLHYAAMISQITPHRFHEWVNRRRGMRADDTFPTVYRVNTPRRMREVAEATGLRLVEARLAEGRAGYLRIYAATYLLGWIYERLVNSVPGCERFRCALIGIFEKPDPNAI